MIGVFDSGLGGLTTLKELQKILPEYEYCYLGDSANAPYGKRTAEQVTALTEKGVDFLFQKGAKIVLLACNTASSDALRFLQKKYKDTDKKVLGVLIPAVEKALENSRYGNIGVVATAQTIETGNFEKEVLKNYPQFFTPFRTNKKDCNNTKFQKIPKVFSVAAPLLVPLIEEGWAKKPETKSILKKYILSLKSCNVDTLILGCTHYPLLQKSFARLMGKNCKIINSGQAQAEKFVEYLQNHPEIQKILENSSGEISGKKIQFFTTDCPEKFQKLGQEFLGVPLPKVKKIEL